MAVPPAPAPPPRHSTPPAAPGPRPRRPLPRRASLAHPCVAALALALPLVALYLAVQPPAGDLAAATYRSELFARVGFTTWDTGWYAAHGHWLPGYSLLSPALGALLGPRLLLALSALAACTLFALIAERAFGGGKGDGGRTGTAAARGERDRTRAAAARSEGDGTGATAARTLFAFVAERAFGGGKGARAAAVVFAFGFCAGLVSGRVPFDLGVPIGLGAVLALMRGSLPLALVLAVLTSVASPVAGSFLALAGVAHGLAGVRLGTVGGWRGLAGGWHGFALAACALLPIAVLAIAFPEGGYEPFPFAAFWPPFAGVLLFALALPRGPLPLRAWNALRVGAALYALALIASYAVHTPMGGNATRLGPLLAAPLAAGVLWERRRALLALALPALLYWQIVNPLTDTLALAHNPSVNASYYSPLRAELRRLGGGIVEVPLTDAHWESAYLAGHDRIRLARGWERQLDTRYAALFYRPTLSPSAYKQWLKANRVAYVALPDARLDSAGELEGRLIASGQLRYLRPIWRSAHWKLYRFIG